MNGWIDLNGSIGEYSDLQRLLALYRAYDLRGILGNSIRHKTEAKVEMACLTRESEAGYNLGCNKSKPV